MGDAAHGYKKFEAQIHLVGSNVEQKVVIKGPRLGEKEDLAGYVAETIATKLQPFSAGDLAALQKQIGKLEEAVEEANEEKADLIAANKELAKELEVATKAAQNNG